MTGSRQGGPRLIDRVFRLFGVPSAVRHSQAIKSVELAIRVDTEVHDTARQLTDALRQLSDSLDRVR